MLIEESERRQINLEQYLREMASSSMDDGKVRDMAVKYPRRKLMQSEFAIIIDNGMASVAAALKTDYHI